MREGPRTTLRRLLRRLREASGFGLIELTIAMSMVAIALVALSAVFVSGTRVFQRAGKEDAAATLADRMLERYRSITWDEIVLSDDLVNATDSYYQSDTALAGSLSNDISVTTGTCSGSDTSTLPITCIPSRTIPDGLGEIAPDHKSYRIDSYVTWGCPDGSTPDPSTGCGGSTFSRVKVVTIVVRDASNLSSVVYRTSTSFDRLGGASMPTVTAIPTGTATTGTGTTTTSSGVPDPPDSILLANGGGTGSAYVNYYNQQTINVDVVLPASSESSDIVKVWVDDGFGTETVSQQGSGILGGGTLHFTGFDLRPLAEGTLTVNVLIHNSLGDTTSSIDVTKDVTPPNPPVSVALQNGGGTGGQYVDLPNESTIFSNVTLDSLSLASDTASVTLSDGTTTTSAGTVAASAGAGTVTSGAVDASALADGTNNITATAMVEDAAGNWSTGVTSTTYSKETVAPVVAITSPTNGASGFSRTGPFTGTAGKLAGDIASVTVEFCQNTSFTAACDTTPDVSGTASVNGSGNWSLTLSTALKNNKPYAMKVLQQDDAGNIGTSSVVKFNT